MQSDILSALAATELFGTLDETDLKKLEAGLQWMRVSGGETLFYQGELGDCLYVVVSGRLRVLHENPGMAERVLGEAGKGETVGEMALLTGAHRSATVRAVRDSELLKLSQDSFNGMIGLHPELTMQLARRIITRYQRSMKGPLAAGSNRVASIAVMPTGRDVSGDFARRLTAALEKVGTVLHIDRARIDAALGPGAADTPKDHSRNHAVVAWLNEQEANFSFLVYEADQTTTWSGRCARQSDRILVVGRSGAEPEPSAHENTLFRQGPATVANHELVLLHRERRSIYPGTSAWMAPRQISRVHHLVENDESDYARLVRRLTGRAVGVVLAGGGARSFAQIGMLRALREAGITFDYFGGTSMGAFLGAQYAMEWSNEKILEYNRTTWRNRRPLRDYTYPYMALIAGQRFTNVVRSLYGEAMIEDLALPYFCCSSNLTRARLVVHRTGTIWRALGASIAVPGLAPPLFENGDLHVDGAALNNLPIDVMREICDGTVIAADVSPPVDLKVDPHLREAPGSWRLAYRRLRPVAQGFRIPTIMEILSRASSLSSVAQVDRMKGEANLYLHAPLEKYSIFDFKKFEELVKAGYDYAKPVAEEWVKGAQPASGSDSFSAVPFDILRRSTQHD